MQFSVPAALSDVPRFVVDFEGRIGEFQK